MPWKKPTGNKKCRNFRKWESGILFVFKMGGGKGFKEKGSLHKDRVLVKLIWDQEGPCDTLRNEVSSQALEGSV
jgi:hypothetical protein